MSSVAWGVALAMVLAGAGCVAGCGKTASDPGSEATGGSVAVSGTAGASAQGNAGAAAAAPSRAGAGGAGPCPELEDELLLLSNPSCGCYAELSEWEALPDDPCVIPTTGMELDNLFVVVDCVLLEPGTEEHGGSWIFDPVDSPTAVVILGAACEALRSGEASVVHIGLGCTSVLCE